MKPEDSPYPTKSQPNDSPIQSPRAIDVAFGIVERHVAPKPRSARALTVCKTGELPVGAHRIAQDGKLSIGAFNIGGALYALRNYCPHQGAPLCEGNVSSTYRPGAPNEFIPALENRVIRCPWHGWEFDIVSGKGLYDRTARVAVYQVRIDEDQNVIVLL